MRKAPKRSQRDRLTTTSEDGKIELTEKELSRATGGLKLDGIEGESHDSKHKNEIDVQSW